MINICMSFSTTIWDHLVDLVSASFRMTDSETEKLRSSKAAKVIGALPYIAGAREPERVAIAHLGTFVLAGRDRSRLVFDHKASDDADVLARLEPIADHPGADKALVDRGLRLLALMMLAGYAKDQDKDRDAGEYNPLISGSWSIEPVREALLKDIEGVASQEMDAIVEPRDAVMIWWDG